MIAAFLMITGQPSVLEATKAQAPDEDIVVIARKLAEWRGSAKWKGDVVTCKTTKSTKNVTADKIACDALTLCTTPDVRSEFTALKDRKIPKADRARRSEEVSRKVNECAEDVAQTHLTALAEKRAVTR